MSMTSIGQPSPSRHIVIDGGRVLFPTLSSMKLQKGIMKVAIGCDVNYNFLADVFKLSFCVLQIFLKCN